MVPRAVRRFRFDRDDVAGTGDDFVPVDTHSRLAGADDANFGIRMLVLYRASPRFKIAEEKGNVVGRFRPLLLGDIQKSNPHSTGEI
jgi:hypothetical protein